MTFEIIFHHDEAVEHKSIVNFFLTLKDNEGVSNVEFRVSKGSENPLDLLLNLRVHLT